MPVSVSTPNPNSFRKLFHFPFGIYDETFKCFFFFLKIRRYIFVSCALHTELKERFDNKSLNVTECKSESSQETGFNVKKRSCK